jgi:hypothetical protein
MRVVLVTVLKEMTNHDVVCKHSLRSQEVVEMSETYINAK